MVLLVLRRFLDRVGREVQTLVVFRNTQDWRESWLHQLEKDPSGVARIAREQPDEVSLLGDWYFDKAAIRSFWSPFNLCELGYEGHDNIVAAMIEKLGLPGDDLVSDFFSNKR